MTQLSPIRDSEGQISYYLVFNDEGELSGTITADGKVISSGRKKKLDNKLFSKAFLVISLVVIATCISLSGYSYFISKKLPVPFSKLLSIEIDESDQALDTEQTDSRTPTQTPLPVALPYNDCTAYIVQPLDTLEGIAAQYSVSLPDLIALNNYPYQNVFAIQAGQVIYIPSVSCDPSIINATPIPTETPLAPISTTSFDYMALRNNLHCETLNMNYVLIAQQAMLRGSVIIPEQVTLACFKAENTSEFVFDGWSVDGLYLTTDIRKGQMISRRYLIDPRHDNQRLNFNWSPGGSGVGSEIALDLETFYGFQEGDSIEIQFMFFANNLECSTG